MRLIDEEDASLSKISSESMEETPLPVRRKGVVHAHVLRRPGQKENKEHVRFLGYNELSWDFSGVPVI